MKRLDDTIKELEYLRDRLYSQNSDLNLNPAINNLLALKEEIEDSSTHSYDNGYEKGYDDGYKNGTADTNEENEQRD